MPPLATLAAAPLLLLLCLLSGCPGGSGASGQPALQPDGNAQQPGQQDAGAAGLRLPPRPAVNYPPMAQDYLTAALREPATEQHSPLQQTWDALSRLADASYFAAEVQRQVNVTSGGPDIQLTSAWLSADPQAAADWLLLQINGGQAPYVNALRPQPELGRAVLREVRLQDAARGLANTVLDVLGSWEPLRKEDSVLLRPMAENEDSRVRLRAIGYLHALGEASPEQLAELRAALRSDRIKDLAAAAEACRISKDASLADELVNQVAAVPLGAAAPQTAQPESTGLYAAYALSYLPGEQARLLRRKLLDAADPQIRWQARLGELLHGDIAPWYDALLKTPPEDPALWVALAPQSLADPALLLTYKHTAQSKEGEIRLRTAQSLNRYGAWPSERVLRETLLKLLDDETEQVAAVAWHSAALLRLPGLGDKAQQLLDNPGAPAQVRGSAAFYIMRLAEPPPAADISSASAVGGAS